MNFTTVLDELDQMIEAAKPEELPALIAGLSAAITKSASRQMEAASHGQKEQADQPIGQPTRNLSVKETASRLGVSAKWLYDNSHTLPFTVRVGRRLLFSEWGMERWMRQGRK